MNITTQGCAQAQPDHCHSATRHLADYATRSCYAVAQPAKSLGKNIKSVGATLIFITLVLLAITNVSAQPFATLYHRYPNVDLKGYAMKPSPNASEHYAAAGTSFNLANGTSNIHYLRMRANGSILNSVIYRPSTDNQDTRVVAIENGPTAGDQYIVALARGSAAISMNDQIRVLHVDAAGVPQNSWLINSSTIFSSVSYPDAYPMGALRLGNNLYICGYLTNNGTAYPSEPDYGPQDTKVALC